MVPVDAIELDELILDELSVVSMRDASAQSETGEIRAAAISCCLSYECCCSCYIPEDPG